MSLNAQHRIYKAKPKLPVVRVATIAALGSCLWLSQAYGQAQPPANQAPAASSANISDQKIKAAATAIPKVEGIRQNYQQQLAQASDNDKPRLQSQAGTEMKKALSDQGLSVADYNAVLETAEKNPDVRARLVKDMPPQDQQEVGP